MWENMQPALKGPWDQGAEVGDSPSVPSLLSYFVFLGYFFVFLYLNTLLSFLIWQLRGFATNALFPYASGQVFACGYQEI